MKNQSNANIFCNKQLAKDNSIKIKVDNGNATYTLILLKQTLLGIHTDKILSLETIIDNLCKS